MSISDNSNDIWVLNNASDIIPYRVLVSRKLWILIFCNIYNLWNNWQIKDSNLMNVFVNNGDKDWSYKREESIIIKNKDNNKWEKWI